MKILKTFLYSVIFLVILTGAVLTDNFVRADSKVQETISSENFDVRRVGAKCCDGTNSKATGRGACSHHGGVKYWKMSDGTIVSTGRCD